MDEAEIAKIRLNCLTSTSPIVSFRKSRCLRKSCQEFFKRDQNLTEITENWLQMKRIFVDSAEKRARIT